jgi:hypothetical protein
VASPWAYEERIELYTISDYGYIEGAPSRSEKAERWNWKPRASHDFPPFSARRSWPDAPTLFAAGVPRRLGVVGNLAIGKSFDAVHYSYKTGALMVLAQVGVQWLLMTRSGSRERVRYISFALSVSTFGSMILLPLLFYHTFLAVLEVIATAYFCAVVGVLFVIHQRLITRSWLPKILSCTWMLYRLLLLLSALIPR